MLNAASPPPTRMHSTRCKNRSHHPAQGSGHRLLYPPSACPHPLPQTEHIVDEPFSNQIFLALFGGGLIAFGAAVAIPLSAGVTSSGASKLLTGFGFICGVRDGDIRARIAVHGSMVSWSLSLSLSLSRSSSSSLSSPPPPPPAARSRSIPSSMPPSQRKRVQDAVLLSVDATAAGEHPPPRLHLHAHRRISRPLSQVHEVLGHCPLRQRLRRPVSRWNDLRTVPSIACLSAAALFLCSSPCVLQSFLPSSSLAPDLVTRVTL